MMQDNGMMSGLTKHPETKHRLVMSESSKITANKYYFNRRRSLKEEVEEGEEGSVTHNISLSSISFSLISLSALPNTLSLTFLFPFNRELFAFIRYKFRNRNPPLYNRSNGSLILFLFDCEIDYVSSYREVEERERGGGMLAMEKEFDSKLVLQGNGGSVSRSKSFSFKAPQENFTIQDFQLGKIYGVGSYSKVIN